MRSQLIVHSQTLHKHSFDNILKIFILMWAALNRLPHYLAPLKSSIPATSSGGATIRRIRISARPFRRSGILRLRLPKRKGFSGIMPWVCSNNVRQRQEFLARPNFFRKSTAQCSTLWRNAKSIRFRRGEGMHRKSPERGYVALAC